jgi:hypothetical protein
MRTRRSGVKGFDRFPRKRRERSAAAGPLKDAGHRDECHDGLLFPPEHHQIMREPDESQGIFSIFAFSNIGIWIFFCLFSLVWLNLTTWY